MATPLIASKDANFESQIYRVKNEIESHFRELISWVTKREEELLNQLEEILNNYKREKDKHKQSLTELETGLNSIKENFKSNNLKHLQDSMIEQITEKRKEFRSQFESKHISLDFDETILELAGTIGRLTVTNSTSVVSSLPVVDYEGKVTPVLSIGGTSGGKEGEFSNPCGVAVHYQTGIIFVADQSNNRVQVFDKDGKFLYMFGAGKMNGPLFIAFYQNKVFVSQLGAGCLLVYDLNGTFLKQIGTPGNGEGQLISPRGITISESNGDIFVCDYGNNRFQIFSKDFLFKSQFGNGILHPSDIKLTNEYIYVLSYTNPFLYSFHYNLTQVQNAVLNSISKHLKGSFSFCIDGVGNFIISDYCLHAIILFNRDGDLVHKITASVQKPVGVTLDAMGRIILVGYNNHLLIF